MLLFATDSESWTSNPKGTSARVRIRAKLKHISQRSAIIETNQDSLSNGEWSGRQWPKHAFNALYRVSFCMSQPIDLIRDLKWWCASVHLIFNEGIVASKDISSCLLVSSGIRAETYTLPMLWLPLISLMTRIMSYKTLTRTERVDLMSWLHWFSLANWPWMNWLTYSGDLLTDRPSHSPPFSYALNRWPTHSPLT